jgi:hypothetical protein
MCFEIKNTLKNNRYHTFKHINMVVFYFKKLFFIFLNYFDIIILKIFEKIIIITFLNTVI